MNDLLTRGKKILSTLHEHGYQGFFVGGCVRDYLLNRPFDDVDITTNAKPEHIISIFPRTVDVAIKHGTILVISNGDTFEVTTYRTESSYSDHRRPDEIHYTSSIEEDLKRRDFTMNAIAMDEEMNLVDPYGGRDDIERQLINTVGEAYLRFNEDALRMLRAIRFQSQLAFTIGEETYYAITTNAHTLHHIAVERIVTELEKFFPSSNVLTAKANLVESTLIDYIPVFKDFDKALFKRIQSTTMLEDIAVQLLLLPSSRFHIADLKLSNEKVKTINKMVSLLRHLDGYTDVIALSYDFDHDILSAVYHLVKSNNESLRYNEASIYRLKQALEKKQSLPIQSIHDIAIRGDELSDICERKPGPWIKSIYQDIEKNILHNNLQNDYHSIKKWVSEHVKIKD